MSNITDARYLAHLNVYREICKDEHYKEHPEAFRHALNVFAKTKNLNAEEFMGHFVRNNYQSAVLTLLQHTEDLEYLECILEYMERKNRFVITRDLSREQLEEMKVAMTLNPKLPIDLMEKLSESSYIQIAAGIAMHPSAPSHLVDKVYTQEHYDVLRIEDSELVGDISNSQDSEVISHHVVKIIQEGHISVDLQTTIAKGDKHNWKYFLAMNPRTETLVLEKIWETGKENNGFDLLATLKQHPKASEELLSELKQFERQNF